MSRLRRAGRLLFIEGIDGAGKTTLARGLTRRLRARGYSVRTHREPTSPALGREAIRRGEQDPFGSALLFTVDRSAARPQVDRLRRRADYVLQDRSYFSTLAYQASRLPPRAQVLLERLQAVSADPPDLVVWIDVPVALALERVRHRGSRSALERTHTLTRARAAYRALAQRHGWLTLDGRRPAAELLEQALAQVLRRSPPRPAARKGGA